MYKIPAEMKINYLNRRNTEVSKLKRSIEFNSIEEFNTCGHQIMGSARNFDFETLEPIAIKMEKLSLNDLAELGPQLIEEYSVWIASHLAKT